MPCSRSAKNKRTNNGDAHGANTRGEGGIGVNAPLIMALPIMTAEEPVRKLSIRFDGWNDLRDFVATHARCRQKFDRRLNVAIKRLSTSSYRD